jgi:4-hydroxy-4-methyl-2-oxoglutarate aldolase
MPGDLVSRLRSLDTCVVSDALDRLGVPGTLGGLAPLTVARRVAGRAVTVELGPATGRSTPGRHLATAAVDSAGPGDVLVVAHQGRTDCAGWGGILSLAAAVRGVEGVVVDGAARDIDEARQLRFPVYGRSPVVTTARGRVVEVGWDRPVTLAGVQVAPGDLVLADGSGVVAVPADAAREVLDVAGELAAREAAMARAVREGQPVSAVMGTPYEHATRGSGDG